MNYYALIAKIDSYAAHPHRKFNIEVNVDSDTSENEVITTTYHNILEIENNCLHIEIGSTKTRRIWYYDIVSIKDASIAKV